MLNAQSVANPSGSPSALITVGGIPPAALAAESPLVPSYLHETYWWAYVHPRAVRFFERQWLVNAILLGNYRRLRDAALNELGARIQGNTLQIACVYGDFTAQLVRRLGVMDRLDVMDVLPVQLVNLRAKLGADTRVQILHQDAAAMALPTARYDQAVLFFLLHEQPLPIRRRTLAEAWRVVRPGGKIVIVDYHAPSSWHPLRAPLGALLRKLEPYALDLWRHPMQIFMPLEAQRCVIRWEKFFGGMYQKLVLQRS